MPYDLIRPALRAARRTGRRTALVAVVAVVALVSARFLAPAVADAQQPQPAGTASPTPVRPSPTAPAARPAAPAAPGAPAIPGVTGGPPLVALAPQLDSLTTAVRGGIAAMPLPVALRYVEAFRAALAGTGDEQLADIAVDLDALHTALSASPINTSLVERVLVRLAPQIIAVAPKAGASEPQVRVLGEQLGRAASGLRPANAPR